MLIFISVYLFFTFVERLILLTLYKRRKEETPEKFRKRDAGSEQGREVFFLSLISDDSYISDAPVAPRLVSQKAMVLRPTRCSPLQ